MKEIPVPAAVEVKFGEGATKSVTFSEFLIDMTDGYGETKTPKQVRQMMKLQEKIEKANGAVCLEDAEFELLKAAIEWPRQLNMKVVKQLISFYAALETAGIGKD